MAVGKLKLKVGDKVAVKVDEPLFGWGYVAASEIGTVSEVFSNGEAFVDFPSQKSWMAGAGELQIIERKIRKSPEKILGYAVMNKHGVAESMTPDRGYARFLKAALGGKKEGVTIVTIQAGKEIR